MKGAPKGLSLQLVGLARQNASGELAWQFPAVLDVVASVSAQGCAILGGDVMHEGEGQLDYYHGDVYCGSWYLDRKPNEQSWAEYIVESVQVTGRYIEAYVRRNGGTFFYVLVIADEDEYATFPRR
jgi:hypothetical protein